MRRGACIVFSVLFLSAFLLLQHQTIEAQQRKLPDTPLSPQILNLLLNEVSGQVIFNNEIRLAGAPWVRDSREFNDVFYESKGLLDLVKGYGIETVKLAQTSREGTFNYPLKGEFWILEPEKRLIARLDADPALVNSGSNSVDIKGDLIYIPPLDPGDLKKKIKKKDKEKYGGKIALMWSPPRGDTARFLDRAGIRGIISFQARDRYFDPDQVVYSRGSYAGMKNLNFGLTISWRQWSELMEDLEQGKKLLAHCKTEVEKYKDRFEWVYTWLPGSEPDKKGVIFTAHLFEGYLKRGANDNMGGCVVQLEILRALDQLIKSDALPKPKRTIHFLWPNEISGTYEFIKQNSDKLADFSANINMDMVSEGLRKNNALFTYTECPNHLPSYIDGLAYSVMNYIWRANDIVYLPDSPRGRRGQHFPRPIWEKNGSRDAFRFSTHRATGGSDHICFNNALVRIPGVELNIWPDQWYHADTDTPDKSDPTQLKRVAFLGAAMAWAIADCNDDVLKGLLSEVIRFGYRRIARQELPVALAGIEEAGAEDLTVAFSKAVRMIDFAVAREAGAVTSLTEIYSGSDPAKRLVESQLKQLAFYGQSLKRQAREYYNYRAGLLAVSATDSLPVPAEFGKFTTLVPKLSSNVLGRETSVERSQAYRDLLKKEKDIEKDLGLNRSQKRSILNFINGDWSVWQISIWAGVESNSDIPVEKVAGYLELLKRIGFVDF